PLAEATASGEHQPIGGRVGMLGPPPGRSISDDELITASGEAAEPAFAPAAGKKLYGGDEAEVTAPVGKPLTFGDDSTVPAGAPLKIEPMTELGVPRHLELKSGPHLVPASTLRHAYDVSEQETAAASPLLEPAPKARNVEGPTNVKA